MTVYVYTLKTTFCGLITIFECGNILYFVHYPHLDELT